MPDKRDAINQWRALPPGQNPLPLMRAIPYKTTGSRYGACGIRIDGSPAFIDAVLSNLKTLLAGENMNTRLELARRPVDKEFKALPNAVPEAECCYIRLHVRGRVGMGRRVSRRRQVMQAGFGLPLPLPGFGGAFVE